MNLSSLSSLPEGVPEALSLIDGLDDALLLGFARLGAEQKAALKALGACFTGAPLSAKLSEALDGATGGGLLAEHLLTLAAARASLNGAVHDALYAQAIAALGLTAPAAAAPEALATPEELGPLLDSVRQWLLELALAGLANVDAQALLSFLPTLERLRERPETARVSLVLTGFIDELLASVPVAALEVLPRKRWADLWCRCMLSAAGLAAPAEGEAVAGPFEPVGVELRHHDHAISAVVHGWLPEAGRWGRAHFTAWKVDAVTGDEALAVLVRAHKAHLIPIAEGKALTLTKATWLPSGELLIAEAKAGAKVDAIEVTEKAMASGVAAPPVAPADRHPVQLGVLALLEARGVEGEGGPALEVGEVQLPIATRRLSPLSGVDPAKLSRVRQVIGLLRFDGGRWEVQPLLAQEGGKTAKQHGPDLASAVTARTPTLDVLRDRAAKLLRS